MSVANPVFVSACFGTNHHAFDLQLLKFLRSDALLFRKGSSVRAFQRSCSTTSLLTVSQVNCNFPTDAFFDRRRKIHATVRDSNGFSIAKIIIASFVTHFDVLKPPTFFVLIICS
jgi:hypothetical protein